MAENQLVRNKRLLTLKGYPTEEEETAPKVDSSLILEQYQQKKGSVQKSGTFDDLDLKWNSDGTLNRMIAYKNGEVLYEMNFAWNPDGTLNKIMRDNGR